MMSISDRNGGSNPHSSDCPSVSSDCRSCDAVCSCKSQAFHCLRSQNCKCGIHSPETSISPRVRKIAFPGTACLCHPPPGEYNPQNLQEICSLGTWFVSMNMQWTVPRAWILLCEGYECCTYGCAVVPSCTKFSVQMIQTSGMKRGRNLLCHLLFYLFPYFYIVLTSPMPELFSL